MLQSIRERAQGWIAWFIVILISIPFALWGIQEYLGGGTESIVATVNGEEITERAFQANYQNFRQSIRQRLGQNYRPELLDEERLRAQVLESMIQEELIRQTSEDLGLVAGNHQIRARIQSIPAFQVAGQFDKQAYERSIRQRGMTSVGFDARIREALVSEQLSNAILDTEVVTETELETFIRLRQQQREFSYLLITAADFVETVEIADGEARSHYDSHQSEYMAPAKVRVEYLELDIDRIAETLKADEESLVGYYEQHKSDYIVPEQRQASHILTLVAEDADETAQAEARALAQSALERVQGGEDFATVAKELSQDPGSADAGGDLGFFEKGIMDAAFEDTAFGMSINDISDLVRSSFGLHIIKLTAIKPETGKSFEQAKSDVEKAYLKSEAERLYYEYAERLNDLAFEDPDSLEPVAEALGMEIQVSDWIEREGGAGIFASHKVAGAAFSDDVLIEGHNSEAIEVGAEHIAVLRIKEHEAEAVRSYESVEEEILTSLKAVKAAEEAERKGREMLDRLAQGENFDTLTQESGGTVKAKKLVGRTDNSSPAPILKKAFQLPRPGNGPAIYGEAKLINGDFAVIALYRVEDGKEEGAVALGGDREALKSSLQRSRGNSYYRNLLQALRDSSEVRIK